MAVLFTMTLYHFGPDLYFFADSCVVDLHRYTVFQTDHQVLDQIMQPMHAEILPRMIYIMHQCTNHNYLQTNESTDCPTISVHKSIPHQYMKQWKH